MTGPTVVPDVRCPDCDAARTGQRIDHRDGCPGAAALDQVCAADRAWFDRRPKATHRYRPMVPGDLGVTALNDVVVTGRVRVVSIAPGIRARYLPLIELVGDGRLTMSQRFVLDRFDIVPHDHDDRSRVLVYDVDSDRARS